MLVSVILVAMGVGGAWLTLAGAGAPTGEDRAIQRAEDFGKSTIVWSQGPSLRDGRVVQLDGLQEALSSLPLPTRYDVDVAGLERQYGANRRVALVILRGTYNSLPPDEGVDVYGNIVVLVDVKTERVILPDVG